MGFYTLEELQALGLKKIGSNVKLSTKASIYNANQIIIGDNSRIDDFCVLSAGSGGIYIGKNVHIAVYSSLIGKETITIEDFANISSKVSIYSSNDDYSGEYMTNPTVPALYTNVQHSPVKIGKHVIVGSGCVVLPGVTLEDGVAIGALSLVNKDCDAFQVYAGIPAKKIAPRSKQLLELEKIWQVSQKQTTDEGKL